MDLSKYQAQAEQVRLLQDNTGGQTAKPPNLTVFDEIAGKVEEQIKRLYTLRGRTAAQIDRLIGNKSQGEACGSSETPAPNSPLEEAFASLDGLSTAITALETEINRLNTLTGDD